MASKFIKGLFEKTTILDDDWLIMQPDAEESTAYKIKKSKVGVSGDVNIWYVSKSGSDSNVGNSKAEPFLTQEAAHTASATDDIIETLDTNVSYNESFTVTKRLCFRGPLSNQNTISSNYDTTLLGTWVMGIDNVLFENFNIGQTFTVSVHGRRIYFNNCFCYPTLTARNTQINLVSSIFDSSSSIGMQSLKAINSRMTGGGTLNIGEDLELYAGCSIDASVVCGIDLSADVVLRNSSITGALTVTGNLDQENSTVLGALSVSGTTTGGSRFPGQVAAQGLILSFDATPAIDFNQSVCQEMTLTGNITDFTTINEFSPVNCDVYLINDGSVRTVVAPTGWTADPTSETHTTAANAINRYQFYTLPGGAKYFNLHIVKA